MIEALVVVAVIAVVAVGVALRLRPSAAEDATAAAADLARAIDYAADEQLFTGWLFGVALGREGWRLMVFDRTAGAWVLAAEDHPAAGGEWSPELAPRVAYDGRPAVLRDDPERAERPDLFLLPEGGTSAVTLALARTGLPALECAGGPGTPLVCEAGAR